MESGEAFMPDVSLPNLIRARRSEPPGKPRDRLQAGVLRKKGKAVDQIGLILGRAQSTVSAWLRRLDKEGLEGRYDRRIPGRPCRLSEEQRKDVRAALNAEPVKSGFERGTWDSNLLATYICRKHDVKYSRAGALALAHRQGFSVRKTRPIHHKSASKEEQERYVRKTVRAIREYTKKGYWTGCMDASAATNSPSSARGLRPRGGTEEVKTNFSRSSMKMVGAIGDDGAYHLHFCESADSDSVIALFERLRELHGKVFLILDNASAHKSGKIKEYLKEAGSDVILWYLPPYTPQQNPIEIWWREIKRALAGRYFEDGFTQMKLAIARMLANGEIPIVKLFKYMRDAIRYGRRRMPSPEPAAP